MTLDIFVIPNIRTLLSIVVALNPDIGIGSLSTSLQFSEVGSYISVESRHPKPSVHPPVTIKNY